MIASLRKDPVWRGRVERTIDFLRQWPWIYPRGIEPSTQAWVQRARQNSGWYAGLRAHWFESIHPGGTGVYEPPANCPTQMQAAFQQVATTQYPEAFACYISGAHITGDEGFVLTPDNRVLAEFHHEFNIRSLRRALLRKPFSQTSLDTQRIAEPIGLLAAPQGWNHYHWLFDVLPRVHLLGRWRNVISRWAVASRINAVQKESLELLGIAEAQRLPLHPQSRLRCQHLYAPSLPGSEGCTPPWVPQFLREQFLPQAGNTAGCGPSLYVIRGTGGERPVLNEPHLIAMLQAQGFRAVDPAKMTFLEQIAAFRDAKRVISAHGAALANLVFSTGTSVLELFSADYPRVDCYFTLSRQLGHTYACWFDQRKAAPEKPWGAITADLNAIGKLIA